MSWGDDDTTGDPRPLCEALEKALKARGIDVSMDASNSYDLTMSLTGHAAVRLLYFAVECASIPGSEVEKDLIDLFVPGAE